MKHKLIVVVCMIVPLLLAACGSTTTTANVTPTSTAMTAKANLMHVPTGTATLNWDPSSKTLTVEVTLTGLAPNSIHPGHIHTGSCAKQGGVLHSLVMLHADAHGNATATTTIPNVTGGIPASGWYVNVHNGPSLSPADQLLPIVCGNVTNSSTSTSAAQSVQVTLNGVSAGQIAVGTAQLTLNGSTLTVKVSVSGLAPNSSHADHIHLGSCEQQGKVLYPLTPLTANASGVATATTTINNVTTIPSSGWYVNVHNSTALATQTGFDPVTCGNVTVG